MTYKIGYTKPIWTTEYKNFDYKRQSISDDEVKKWRQMGYTHNSFTGEMYDSKNPIPEWCDSVAESIGLRNCGYVIYKMNTGDIMPTHVDHFSKYCEIFNTKRELVWRTVVFLEDWQSGHYFDIGGRAFMNYKAGEWVSWSCDEPHFAANIGVNPRYTLQITGIV
jgi:hypothetical protein